MYLPHAAGWHLDTKVLDRPLDLGYFRLRGDMTLYALAGASIALEAGATLMITGDKQGLKGTPKNQAGAKAKVGAKGEANVFAGLKEGIDLAGALQWLNPEGIIDPSSPKKANPNKAVAAYADVASISAGASLIQGLAANLGFECTYKDGRFAIAAKAGGCLGLGGSGSVACKVEAVQIGQFFMCIAHQLKQCDYRKLTDLMKEDAFSALNMIFYSISAGQRKLESFVGARIDDIEREFIKISDAIQQSGEQAIKKIGDKLKSGWGWYSYMPPEARGAMIRSIADVVNQPRYAKNNDLRKIAAFSVNELMSTIQSTRHLNNTLDRITISMGDELDRNQGVKIINSVVTNTIFSGCVQRCETQLSRAEPLMGRPFLRNDESDFLIAQFPLHHCAYKNPNLFSLKS
jgi:hypothetical protein